jgi:hypothetical protein
LPSILLKEDRKLGFEAWLSVSVLGQQGGSDSEQAGQEEVAGNRHITLEYIPIFDDCLNDARLFPTSVSTANAKGVRWL